MYQKYGLKFRASLVCVIAMLFVFSPWAKAQSQAKRTITHVAGDLYRFQNNAHVSVFLVTGDGVIATDPINKEAAQWLEQEIKQRFNQDIKYVIYSHSDADHVSGGQVFNDSAIIVAHERAKPIIAAGNYTAVPEQTFANFHVVELGGKKVELFYFGPSHTDNLIVMRFPQERAVFTVDAVSVKSLPYRNLPAYYMPQLISYVQGIAALDFDVLIPGHGPMGNKQDVRNHQGYLMALDKAVHEAKQKGLSLAQAQQQIKLDAYQHWDNYKNYLPLNIEGMYRILGDS